MTKGMISRYKLLLLVLIFITAILIYSAVNDDLLNNEVVKNNNDLNDKINPNTASWQSMARLPGIGEGKSRAIIDYREEYIKKNKSELIVFNHYKDLCNVRGIGEITAEKMKEYLCFE